MSYSVWNRIYHLRFQLQLLDKFVKNPHHKRKRRYLMYLVFQTM